MERVPLWSFFRSTADKSLHELTPFCRRESSHDECSCSWVFIQSVPSENFTLQTTTATCKQLEPTTFAPASARLNCQSTLSPHSASAFGEMTWGEVRDSRESANLASPPDAPPLSPTERFGSPITP